MATATAATAGRTEQHSAVTDRGLTDFPLGRFNQLVANTLRVPALAYESVSATEMLAPTLAEFEAAEINDLLLVTQAVTTGQTAQSMCFATSLSTAKKILDTGLIPVEQFTNSQVNNWFCPRSALLRSLQIYWSGLTDTLDVQEQMALIIYNPGLERYLTSSTVHGLKSNWIDTEGKIEVYTDFNGLYLDHCWTTGSLQLGVQLNTAE